ncbi:MAG TPA: amino acid adenylation domain-containing protein [Longimicrobium sp.]|jgi:amino acid adenylation domain-containing protein/non-ribosomal peptide synthase protein (TIGR01720 family)|uniref:amino acid adenylation domain-containing protein n=1 Tax=Longimicrobium sp. TaxID=2029185 RepID=UPI002EDBA020
MSNQTSSRASDRLSEAQRLLLQKRLTGQVKPAQPVHAITRRGGGPVHPMSWAQERLWYLDQLEPGNPFYNIPIASLCSARLDVPILERTLTEIVRRHEGLRTVFRLVDGAPKQIVQPAYPITVEIEEMRGPNGEAAPEEVIRERVSQEGGRPFDLAAGPLMRAKLLRVSDADYALVIVVHHIVTDGWSMPIITRELDELYGAYARGLPSPLPELEIQYADYSAWQREYLTGDTLQKQLDYWRGHMDGAPTLDLPSDRPRPAVQTHRGAIHRFVWNTALTERLRELGVRTGSSMNMLIMAGYYLMLHRYSGQDDIVVGTLLGNRNRAETEPVVGFFVNSAPIRVHLRPEMSFLELVAQVRTAVLDGDAHQDLPFDRIVDAVTSERDPSRNPLFQVMYFHHTFVKNLHHKEHSEVGSELNMRSLFQETGVSLVDTHATKFDQTFATLEMNGQLANMVEYASDLWDEPTMARMMDHVRVLLESACDRPDAPIATLAMTADEERAQLLAWSTGAEARAEAATVVALFDRHADAAPHAPAAECGDERLTYADVRAQMDAVARRLVGMGVTPGDRVGLVTGQSARMVALLGGILKAGACVVPLDPEYPAERLAFMVDDAAVKLVIGTGCDALRPFAARGTATLDAADAGAFVAEDDRPLPAPGPDAEAYVIYTSGSTGRPKGVRLTHGALVRTVHRPDFVAIGAGDRIAQAANLSFDAAVFEVWAALVNGACSVAVDRDALLDTAEYASTLRHRGITHTFITTQLFNRHVRQQADVFAPLAAVMFGGEQVDAEAVRTCLRGGPPARLLHVYGPTETTVFATAHTVSAVDDEAHTVAIGRPIAATRAYVLDGHGMLAAIGVPGELYLGGERVAAGYVSRPELTAERFVADPFAGGEARMYRTGDRVRWLADGTLEFLGREDDQVKVRGFRIEPGEVESALRAHDLVREAFVHAPREPGGERRLVAYVAGDDGDALQATDFRAFLRTRLPDYMIPSAFVALDELPLTPNGKVDRKRLPAADSLRSERAAAALAGVDAPRDATERVLCELWAEVLRVEQVGIHDNFFALGGDSILSIQIIARAAQRGVRVTPRQMFIHQTVAELAAVAAAVEAPRAEQDAVTGTVPLTPVQRWFFAQELPDPAHFNLALLLEMRDIPRVSDVEDAVAAVLAHHDALRLRFRREGGAWVAENAGVGGPVPFERIDLSAVPAERVDDEVAARAAALQTSLNLSEGPLVRFALLELGAGRASRLLVIAHHLVVDAISLGLLMADLESAYRQIARGNEVRLPPKTTSFRQWAEALAAHARTDAAKDELAFWSAQGGASALPRDGEGENTEAAVERITVQLDEEETRALLQEVPPVYGTQINDALLAALAMAFREWTGRDELRIDLEGHGREDLFEGVDLSRTAGWFTAIYPVRLALPATGEPGDALKAVKEQLRAVPSRGIGFGLLRWMGDDETRRTLAAIPAPEISFNYLGQMDGGAVAESLFAPSHGDVGPTRGPAGARSHLIGVDALVGDGRLHVTWAFAPGVHRPDTVERLAAGYLDALRTLIAHCRDPQAGGFTPSDFDLAGLDQSGLDAVMAQLSA